MRRKPNYYPTPEDLDRKREFKKKMNVILLAAIGMSAGFLSCIGAYYML